MPRVAKSNTAIPPCHSCAPQKISFQLDMRRAVAVENRLVARVRLDGGGSPGPLQNEASASFAAAPRDDPWRDYQIIMWQDQTPAGYARLKQLGITGGMVMVPDYQRHGSYNADQLKALLDQDLGFYLENIATDFYSPYHRWYPNHPVNWKFLEVEQTPSGQSGRYQGIYSPAQPFRSRMAGDGAKPADARRTNAASVSASLLRSWGRDRHR